MLSRIICGITVLIDDQSYFVYDNLLLSHFYVVYFYNVNI